MVNNNIKTNTLAAVRILNSNFKAKRLNMEISFAKTKSSAKGFMLLHSNIASKYGKSTNGNIKVINIDCITLQTILS